MKKKIVLCLIFMFLLVCVLSAQERRFYRDYKSGYSGEATAIYYSSSKSAYAAFETAVNGLRRMGMMPLEIGKLTSAEVFLVWSALGEFDVRDGEFYVVNACSDMSYSAISVVITIVDKGQRFVIQRGFRF